jgi:cell division protein FtsX
MFSSKDDALKFLEQKIPNVVSNFEKFGIDNPIPSTLYVMFKNKDQYNSLKSVILEYKDIVLNVKDIDAGSNIKEQENRTLKFINLANFVMTLSLSIIVFIFITIFAFLGFFTKVIFQHFKEHFQLQKMLGALTTKVAKDFMTLNMIVVLT